MPIPLFLWDFKKLCLEYKIQISTCCNFIHSLYTHIDVHFYVHIMASLLSSTVNFVAKLTGHVSLTNIKSTACNKAVMDIKKNKYKKHQKPPRKIIIIFMVISVMYS